MSSIDILRERMKQARILRFWSAVASVMFVLVVLVSQITIYTQKQVITLWKDTAERWQEVAIECREARK